jgi:phage recombination protein Bet
MNEITENPVNSMTEEQWKLVKKTLLDTDKVKYSDDEFRLFVNQCKRTGLDPFTRQIYATKVQDKMTVQATIDGLRLIASRSNEYEGQTRPVWFDKDGKEYKVWTKSEYPYACEVGVYKKGFREPLYALAIFDEYVTSYKDYKTGEMRVGFMWNKMPSLMIAKVAEAQALRKAFPNNMSGIYSSDEVANVETTVVEKKELPEPPAKKIVNAAPISRQQADELKAAGTSKNLDVAALNKIVYDITKKTKWSDMNLTEYETVLNRVMESSHE